jgi:hypothetical protein
MDHRQKILRPLGRDLPKNWQEYRQRVAESLAGPDKQLWWWRFMPAWFQNKSWGVKFALTFGVAVSTFFIFVVYALLQKYGMVR